MFGPTDDDHALAHRLAGEAGHLLVELRDDWFAKGLSAWALRDEGDMRAHHFLVDAISAARPDDGLISEEGWPDPSRLTKERVWIVDPLDGTNEFGELGRPDWAVHVALVVRGEPVCGAVALPVLGITYSTQAPPTLPVVERRLRVVSSRSRTTYAAHLVAEALDADIAYLGSAGAKAMAVVRGEVDVYAHSGGMYEWDSCAPAAVARAAGLHVSRIDGSPLVYNQRDPWMPDFLVCRPELAERVLSALWD